MSYKRYELSPTVFEVFKALYEVSNRTIRRRELLDMLGWNTLRVGHLMRALYKLQDLGLYNIHIIYNNREVVIEVKRNFNEYKAYKDGKKYVVFIK